MSTMPDTITSERPDRSPSLAWWLILAGVAVHATMILRAEPLQSANDRSRWCTVWSLLERGTYQIDEIRQVAGWDTIDLIYDGGHFYSTKPPILATWISGVVWLVKSITGWTWQKNTQSITSWSLLIANGLPMFGGWMVCNSLLRHTMASPRGHGLLLASAIFATLLTPFAVTLNNHTVAAAGAMVTIYALWRILRTTSPSGWWFAVCGFSAAWTCAHELPAAVLGLITFGLCGGKCWQKTLLSYVPCAAIPLAAFFLTNYLATGGFELTYASYGSEKYRFVIDGVPSYWMEPKGVDANPDSVPVYLMHCLVGHHGLFSLTPLWLLLFCAWPVACRFADENVTRADPLAIRFLSWISLFLTLIVLAFYFSRTENYNYGGVSCALRWAVWLTPFWLVSLIPVVNRWENRRVFRLAVIPLFLISGYSAWSRVENPWKQPWIFAWMESRGWIDYSEPRKPLPHPTWSWLAALPDVSDGKPRWMELRKAGLVSGDSRVRIEVQSAEQPDRVRLSITQAEQAATQVEILRAAFESGSKPAEFVRWTAADITPADLQRDLAIIRGLPELKEYRPGVTRYRKTPLRTDAFRCQHAFAQVEIAASDQRGKWRYRCDVWRCEELPFGIAEVEFQIHDVATGQVLHQERWQPVACEPPPLPKSQWSPE